MVVSKIIIAKRILKTKWKRYNKVKWINLTLYLYRYYISYNYFNKRKEFISFLREISVIIVVKKNRKNINNG